MPIYEYECSKGHQFEAEQRISEAPLTRCRVCKAKARRLISRTSFILKGGGWYADGYGSGKGKSEASSTSASSDNAGNGDKKSETKKSETKKSETKKDSSTTSSSSSKSSPAGASAS
jgi:putative FmdB family regulatory protein